MSLDSASTDSSPYPAPRSSVIEPGRPAARPLDLIGKQVGRFTLRDMIGSGGSAAVFRAIDGQGESAAIKVLLTGEESAEAHRGRFRQEAEVTRRLVHPNIVRFIDYAEEPFPHLALEYVAGTNLLQLLTARHQLSLPEALEIARPMLAALDYAHGLGVIHRDLKPANVLMADDGRVLVADFGLGRAESEADLRLTVTGQYMGTPLYSAPEQFKDPKRVDRRSDLYSFGIVLFRLLAGQPPYEGSSIQVTMAHLSAKPPPVRAYAPSVPGAIEDLILRLLAKRPEDRPASARAVMDELDAVTRETAGVDTMEFSPRIGESVAIATGTVIAGWQIGDLLGAGGMAKVFRASKDGRHAALKILAPHLLSDGTSVARFEREVSVLRGLEHQNVVRVFEAGAESIDGGVHHFMAVEYVGRDLAHRLTDGGPLAPAEAARLAICVGRGLAAVHEHGIVHRDVKPANILISESDSSDAGIKVTDFGIAALTSQAIRLTQTATPVGSAHYMAPEQVRASRDIDGRADVYGLGATLYHALTGRRLFAAATYDGLLLAHASELPELASEVRGGVPQDLALLVDHAVLKRVEDRPKDMREFVADLEAWLRRDLPPARLQEVKRITRRGRRPFERRRALPLAVTVAALVALLVVSAVAVRATLFPVDAVARVADGDAGRLAAMLKDLETDPLTDGADGRRAEAARLEAALKEQLEALAPRPAWAARDLAALPALAARLAKVRDALLAAAAIHRARDQIDAGLLEKAGASVEEAKGLIAGLEAHGAPGATLKALSGALREIGGKRALAAATAEVTALEEKVAAGAYEEAIEVEARARAALGTGESGARTSDLRARIDAAETRRASGLSALDATLTALERDQRQASSSEAFDAVQARVLALRDALPPGNPALLTRVRALERTSDRALVERRRVLEEIEAGLAATPPGQWSHARLIDDLQAKVIAGRDDEVANKGRDILRRVVEARDADAERRFRTLVADEEKILAGAPLPEAFDALARALEPLGVAGSAVDPSRVARHLEELAARRKAYGAELLSRAHQALLSRPAERRSEFLARLTLAALAAERSALYPPIDDALRQRSLSEIEELRRLHEETRMKPLPGGRVTIGRDEPGLSHNPAHAVDVAPYLLDVGEVSVADYARFLAFIEAAGHAELAWCPPGRGDRPHAPLDWEKQLAARDLPVRGVTWDDARAFAAWAGKRLPTEVEWEAAARRGIGGADGPYAWGGAAPDAARCRFLADLDEEQGPAPTSGMLDGATRDGLLHMSGNVAEWTASRLSAYPGAAAGDMRGLDPDLLVVRGGSYGSEPFGLSVWRRTGVAAVRADLHVGFRCAATP